MGVLTALPEDLLKLVTSWLEQPEPLLRSCKAFAALQGDAHALALWAVRRWGAEALAALVRSSSVAAWPLPRVQEAVRFVLELGDRPQGACSCLLLHWAAVKLGDGTILQLLLSSAMQPPPDARMLGGQLLTDACAAGHAGAVAVLLSSGAEPRPGDATALQAAAEHGHLDVVQLLLAWGRIDAKAGSNCALRMAARHGHANVVAALAAAGCDPRARQDEALSLAVAGGYVEAARALLDAGADACSRAGMLLLAVSSAEADAPAPTAGSEGRRVTGRLSCSSDCSSSSYSSSSRQLTSCRSASVALDVAVRARGSSHSSMLQLLWEAGARDEGGAALCAAAAMGRDALVAQLLALMTGAGGGDGTGDGQGGPCVMRQQLTAALHAALSSGHLVVAERLLHAGAGVDASLLTPSQPFSDRRAALALLARFPHAVLCPGLSGRQGEELLAQAATESDDQFVGLLLRWGADATAADCQALRRAVLHGRLACVRAIMKSAGVLALQRQLPCCAMRVAVQSGNLEMVSELVGAGLWPGREDAHHCCADPSTCAARMLCVAGCPDTAALLLRCGGAAHAGTALRLVACGRAPSWRSEAVVVSVMDAMVKQQLAGRSHRGRAGAAASAGTGADAGDAWGGGKAAARACKEAGEERDGQCSACCHEEEEEGGEEGAEARGLAGAGAEGDASMGCPLASGGAATWGSQGKVCAEALKAERHSSVSPCSTLLLH